MPCPSHPLTLLKIKNWKAAEVQQRALEP
jgi:hypothetical protein